MASPFGLSYRKNTIESAERIIKKIVYPDFDEYASAFNDKKFTDIKSKKFFSRCSGVLRGKEEYILLMYKYAKIDGHKLSHDAYIFFPEVLSDFLKNIKN